MWRLPTNLVMKKHVKYIKDITYEHNEDKTPPNRWYCKLLRYGKRRRRKGVAKRSRAADVLQGFARCIIARNRVLDTAYRVFGRVLDEGSGLYFYYNLSSGASMWTKPYGIFMKSTNPEPAIINNSAAVESARGDMSARLSARGGNGNSSGSDGGVPGVPVSARRGEAAAQAAVYARQVEQSGVLREEAEEVDGGEAPHADWM